MSETLSRVMVQVYSKLAATFGVANTVPQPSDAILSIMIPGLVIDTQLDPDKPETQYYVANALDPTLACSWTVARQGSTVSHVYRTILDGKETPLVELPPEQRKRVDAALALLFVDGSAPSLVYREYLDHQSRYLTALDAFEEARATADNGGRPIPPVVREALERAEREWDTQGHRAEVGRALDTLRLYEAYEPSVYWARLARQFEQWTRNYGIESQYQYITSVPPFRRWFHDEGWTVFRFEPLDARNQQRSGAAGVGVTPAYLVGKRQIGGLGLRLGGPAGAGPGDDDDPGVDDVRLYCRLRRIEIERPWMDVHVFASRAWRWSPASVAYGSTISTGGDLAGSVVPHGTMPVLPVTAVLSRDLVITWEERSERGIAERVRAAIEAGHEASLGPFDLRLASVIERGRIEMPYPQLIGFRSLVLSPCPNPDPNLPWPSMRPSALSRIAVAHQ